MSDLGFFVFNGTEWLQDDEQSWGSFAGAAAFTERDVANDIGKREVALDKALYVFELMPA